MFLEALGQSEKDEIMTWATAYNVAYREATQDVVQEYYQYYLESVQRAERATGITVLSSPDNSYYSALYFLTDIILRISEQNQKRFTPVNGTKSFGSVSEADSWLGRNLNITVSFMDVQSGGVTIGYTDHKKPTGYIYGMVEENRTKLRLTGEDIQTYKMEWQYNHPGRDIMFIQMAKGAIGNASALILGFGPRIEKSRVVILYRLRS